MTAAQQYLGRAQSLAERLVLKSGVRRSETVSSVLCSGLDGHEEPIDDETCLDLYHAFAHYVLELQMLPCLLRELSPDDAPGLRKASSYRRAISDASSGRQLCTTTHGIMGMALSRVRVGDTVVVLFGGQYPFVLRAIDIGLKRYEIVGSCYAYGIMNGEPVESWSELREDAEKFVLT